MARRQKVLSQEFGAPKGRPLTPLFVKIGGICTISALTVTAIGGIEAGGAPATPSAAQVAQSYIAAIGPANAELTKVDAELKALSITATYAQVASIVKPLGSALKPLEALAGAAGKKPTPNEPTPVPTTTQPGSTVQLSSLGAPVGVVLYSQDTSTGWGSWGAYGVNPCVVTNLSAAMTMGGKHYTGVQSATTCNQNPEVIELTWRFGTARTFTASIGLDSSSPSTSVTLGFVTVVGTLAAPSGLKEVPFMADGQPVKPATVGGVPSIPIYSGVPTPVKVDVAGLHDLTIIYEVSGPNPIVDFANATFES